MLRLGFCLMGFSVFTQYVVRIETLMRGFCPDGILSEGILSEGIVSWIQTKDMLQGNVSATAASCFCGGCLPRTAHNRPDRSSVSSAEVGRLELIYWLRQSQLNLKKDKQFLGIPV